MKIGANKWAGASQGLTNKAAIQAKKEAADMVSLGGANTDNTLLMGDQLRSMKADPMSDMVEAGCMAGATLLGGGIGMGVGAVGLGTGAGFAAAALGAGGWGVFGAVVGGVLVGGFGGFHLGAHMVTK